MNALSTPAFCPDAKQPELKHAAVRISKAELPWSLLAMAWLPGADALTTRRALAPLMAKFSFTSCVLFGSDTVRSGLLFRAAAAEAPDEALLERIETLLGLDGPTTLRYVDRQRGQRRAARLAQRDDGHAVLEAFLLGGDIRAGAWIGTLLREELPAQQHGRLLLSPGAAAPLAVQSRGKAVCNCLNVSDLAIRAELGRCGGTVDERLAHLQAALKCGTQCGSCMPELRRMARTADAEAATATAS